MKRRSIICHSKGNQRQGSQVRYIIKYAKKNGNQHFFLNYLNSIARIRATNLASQPLAHTGLSPSSATLAQTPATAAATTSTTSTCTSTLAFLCVFSVLSSFIFVFFIFTIKPPTTTTCRIYRVAHIGGLILSATSKELLEENKQQKQTRTLLLRHRPHRPRPCCGVT